VSLFAEELNYSNPAPGHLPGIDFRLCAVNLGISRQRVSDLRWLATRETNYMDPRSGWRTAVGFDLGTPYLGGSNNFYKYYLDVVKYTPLLFDTRFSIPRSLWRRSRHRWGTHSIDRMIFVGGINTMRGFKFGRAGR